ncbi:beta-galactosidase family protein [Streptomyces sp. NPDC049597]|uniref:glycoside hydrolase family 35 protein n=1 Tax=Streptomyces sp. NPDC049597 TaxID=3155276 RepID=UPI0034374BED
MPVLHRDSSGFLLDGEPFRILSGGLHYFRVHPDQWADRLRKARLMGLNTVETYVPWNLHQPRPGTFVMDGPLDLPRFIDLAAAEGLYVLLRPGPYICAEWEGGGLPSWLLAQPDIELRSRDPRFLAATDDYLTRLMTPLRSRLATNGGPILAVQVENEYGAYGDDTAYLEHLADTMRRCGVDVLLFTCDQPADLERGALPDTLATANFGSRSGQHLANLRERRPDDPFMTTEFWIGWFDRWGGHHVVRDTDDAARELDELLASGASVNFYMFHGGTNFGFTNGANDKHTYRPTITSYDYDAPLDEAGDPTQKFTAFRDVIARHTGVPAAPLPPKGPKLSLENVRLTETAELLSCAAKLGGAVEADRPLTMEELGQDFGFVQYETVLPAVGPALLEVEQVRDRAQVFLDGEPAGVLERENHEHALAFTVPRPGCVLTLLVENQGRVNYGQGIHDRKGLLGNILLDGRELRGWSSRPLRLDSLADVPFAPTTATPIGPALHRGVFELTETADTFLHLPGWTKGNAWINGFHLGRHWSRGPQRSLFVPAPVLRQGENEIVVLELHAAHRARTVSLREEADLGPTEE